MPRDIVYYVQLFVEAAAGGAGIRLYEEPRYDVISALPGRIEVRRTRRASQRKSSSKALAIKRETRRFASCFAILPVETWSRKRST